ncbi:MAG: hypothetical protein ORN49_13975 [Rhodobacteraceae bacterium]|nr:hypothetical protein [Paracoccaceae bacterium]
MAEALGDHLVAGFVRHLGAAERTSRDNGTSDLSILFLLNARSDAEGRKNSMEPYAAGRV